MSEARRDRTTVDDAVAELRAIRSSDPCAAIAMTTLKATIHTLETHWSDRSDGREPGSSSG